MNCEHEGDCVNFGVLVAPENPVNKFEKTCGNSMRTEKSEWWPLRLQIASTNADKKSALLLIGIDHDKLSEPNFGGPDFQCM